MKSLKKIRKGKHEKTFCDSSKTFKNISWPMNICLKYFIAPVKTIWDTPSYMLNVRSLNYGREYLKIEYFFLFSVYANSSINLFLCYFRNKEIRQGMHSLLNRRFSLRKLVQINSKLKVPIIKY